MCQLPGLACASCFLAGSRSDSQAERKRRRKSAARLAAAVADGCQCYKKLTRGCPFTKLERPINKKQKPIQHFTRSHAQNHEHPSITRTCSHNVNHCQCTTSSGCQPRPGLQASIEPAQYPVKTFWWVQLSSALQAHSRPQPLQLVR